MQKKLLSFNKKVADDIKQTELVGIGEKIEDEESKVEQKNKSPDSQIPETANNDDEENKSPES